MIRVATLEIRTPQLQEARFELFLGELADGAPTHSKGQETWIGYGICHGELVGALILRVTIGKSDHCQSAGATSDCNWERQTISFIIWREWGGPVKYFTGFPSAGSRSAFITSDLD